MIKYTRQGNGLQEYFSQVPYVDTDQFSKNYFRVTNLPDRFYLGKNAFRISGNNDNLVRDSRIYVDVVDSTGEIIYHEVLDVVTQDKSRILVVYIYGDTPPGDATIYIAGRIQRDPRTNEPIPYNDDPTSDMNKNVPNIMWTAKVSTVTTKQNNSEVFFVREPTVVYTEKLVNFTELSGSVDTRFTAISSSGVGVSMRSRVTPNQYSQTSVFETEFVDSSKKVRSIPDVTGNVVESKRSTRLPEFAKLTTLKSDAPLFGREMEGGLITIKNIDIDSAGEVDLQSVTFDYSASIVKVINSTTVQVDRPFRRVYEYNLNDGGSDKRVFDSFYAQNDFTISYYDTSLDTISSTTTGSYVSMEFKDMEPSAGTVDRIKIAYKPVGAFGEFIDIGDFKIEEQNFLTDADNFELDKDRGLVEKPIGYPSNNTDVQTYWTSSGVGVSGATLSYTNEFISDGFRLIHSGSSGASNYVTVKQNDEYINVVAGTEYKLKFNSYSNSVTSSAWSTPFVDVYISGSVVTTGRKRRDEDATIVRGVELGTYIGTVSSTLGRLSENEFYFRAQESTSISPVFVVRAGQWDFGQIEINPRKEIGFSPNHVKFNIPVDRFELDNDLIIDVKYYNNDGLEANVDTRLFGVVFTGVHLGEIIVSGSDAHLNSLTLDDPLTVPNGGTGNTSFPEDEVLVGNGTGSINSVPRGTISGSDQIDVQGGEDSIMGSGVTFSLKGNVASGSNLNDISDLPRTGGTFIVGSGSDWIAQSGSDVRDTIGLGDSDTPTFDNIILSNPLDVEYGGTGVNTFPDGEVLVGNGTGSINSVTRGDISGGTQIGVDGGANSIMGSGVTLRIHGNVASGSNLNDISDLPRTGGTIIVGTGSEWIVQSGSDFRDTIELGDNDAPSFDGISITNSTGTSSFEGAISASAFYGDGSNLTGLITSYNDLDDKIIIENVGEYRVLTSDGTASGSLANDKFLYKSTGSWYRRTRHLSGSHLERAAYMDDPDLNSQNFNELEMSVVHYTKAYHVGNVTSSLSFNIDYPIYRRDSDGSLITSASGEAAYALQIETTIFGRNGDSTPPLYVWASTHQNRLVSSIFYGTGSWYSYTGITISGSMDQMGSYGYGDPMAAWDSAYTVGTSTGVVYGDAEPKYRVEHEFVPPGVGIWDLTVMSDVKVIRTFLLDLDS